MTMLADELKIYEDTYQFSLKVLTYTRSFHADFKPTLKQNMCQCVLSMFSQLQLANRNIENRVSALTDFLIKCEQMKVFIRMSYDLKQLSDSQTADLNKRLVEITKQANAWKR